VDRKILEFALSNTLTSGNFTINSQGACRSNPELAKAVISKIAGVKFGDKTDKMLDLAAPI
jgi:hypothetical protein